MQDKLGIRATIAGDGPHLKALYQAAFPAENLLPLVEHLLAKEPDILSLLAVIDDQCVGHILLTKCGVGDRKHCVALLGPLAVAPTWQKRGVGRALIREGFRRLGQTDLRRVLVLGDPAYYGRFGFLPEHDIVPPFDLPADWSDAWQSVSVGDDAERLSGILRPPAVWLSPSLWAP
ncbi:MAG: N-acetyltransferase [Xanthobacteraceae bacterium]|nr:N-acetyltransferase [Xanthobacteraceae bacterium]